MKTDKRLPPDYHTHCELCGHAQGQLSEYVQVALEKGLPAMACTDHNPTTDEFDTKHRMMPAQFETYRAWYNNVEVAPPFNFLFGIEADYYPGCEPLLSKWLGEHPFDIVLGSIHYLDFWKMESYETNPLWFSSDTAKIWKMYFQLIGQLADSGLYDVVTHIDLPKKSGRRPSDHIIRETVRPALDRIAKAGMGIEINTSGLHHDVNEAYPSEEILTWAFEREIPITFASDAHIPEHVASDFPVVVELAKRVGYTHSLRFNQRQKTLEPLGG